MLSPEPIRNTAVRNIFCADAIVLLDGAVGTELEHRGYQTSLPLWSARAALDDPELLLQIHSEYVTAGADVITANTFRTTHHTLGKTGEENLTAELITRSVALARQAAARTDRHVAVAASLAPVEDCYSPQLAPPPDEIRRVYERQVKLLHEAAPDLVLVETMINVEEARAAAQILRAADIPFVMSFLANQNGYLLDGTPLESVLDDANVASSVAIMLNCRPAGEMLANLTRLTSVFGGLKGVYANGAGRPGGPNGWIWANSEESVEEYVSAARQWVKSGARIIGGCCGTTPEHIAALAKLKSELMGADL